MKPLWMLIAALCLGSASPTQAVIKIRVSIKFILDKNGNRAPATAMAATDNPNSTSGASLLNTDEQVVAQVDFGNEVLRREAVPYEFQLTEIVEVQNDRWFGLDARNADNKEEIEDTAKTDKTRFKWRDNAINVYIGGSFTAGVSSFAGIDAAAGGSSGQAIFLGQSAGVQTLVHEVGHFFDLCHTQGCGCSGCGEANNVQGCDDATFAAAFGDGIGDTLLDSACFSRFDIAQRNFDKSYSELNASQKRQVDETFQNVMSYHGTGDSLTVGSNNRNQFTMGQIDDWALTASTTRRVFVSGRVRFVKPTSDPFGTGDSHNSAMALDDALDDAEAGDALRFDAGSYQWAGETLRITKRVTLSSRGGAVRITAN